MTYFLIVSTSVSVLGSIDYRPDTFMFMFFFLATFYLLKYLKNTSLPDIVLSFLLYFLSFLCSQKIILNLVKFVLLPTLSMVELEQGYYITT